MRTKLKAKMKLNGIQIVKMQKQRRTWRKKSTNKMAKKSAKVEEEEDGKNDANEDSKFDELEKDETAESVGEE